MRNDIRVIPIFKSALVSKNGYVTSSILDLNQYKTEGFMSMQIALTQPLGGGAGGSITMRYQLSNDLKCEKVQGLIADYETHNDGTQTKITYTSHGMSNGDLIEIFGTSHYNGQYNIYEVDTNTFVIDRAFKTDGTVKANGTYKRLNYTDVDTYDFITPTGASDICTTFAIGDGPVKIPANDAQEVDMFAFAPMVAKRIRFIAIETNVNAIIVTANLVIQ